MLDFLTIQATSTNPALLSVIYAVLLSFSLASAVAFTYERTFRGLSYSRNFVQSLILSPIVAATVMQAIGDSLARGLGMMGALAIIRFRTTFKDPRDIIFMFAALAAGISCGVNAFTIAVVGSLGFCCAAIVLYISPLGQNRSYDGILRFNTENDRDQSQLIDKILHQYCHIFALITLREMAQTRLEYAYQIKLRRGKTTHQLIAALKQEDLSIRGVNAMLQETTVEI